MIFFVALRFIRKNMLQPVFKGFDINIQYLMQAQANHDKRHMFRLIRNPIFHSVVLTFVMSFSTIYLFIIKKKWLIFCKITSVQSLIHIYEVGKMSWLFNNSTKYCFRVIFCCSHYKKPARVAFFTVIVL